MLLVHYLHIISKWLMYSTQTTRNVLLHEAGVVGRSVASVTPKRASSTSAIWWFDKAFIGGPRRGRAAMIAAVGSAVGCARRPAGRVAAHVAERAARRGAGRERQGQRQHTGTPRRHAHTRAADTTPAPEERHCALSQPSLNEHSARHPPLGTNSIRAHCVAEAAIGGCTLSIVRRSLCIVSGYLQGHVNYQSDRCHIYL